MSLRPGNPTSGVNAEELSYVHNKRRVRDSPPPRHSQGKNSDQPRAQVGKCSMSAQWDAVPQTKE